MAAVGDDSGGGSTSPRSRPSRCRPRHRGCLRGSRPRCDGVPDDVYIWCLAITVLVEPPDVPLSAVVSGPEYFRADALPCAGWSQGGRAGWSRQVVAPGGRAGWRVGHSACSLSDYDGEGGHDLTRALAVAGELARSVGVGTAALGAAMMAAPTAAWARPTPRPPSLGKLVRPVAAWCAVCRCGSL